MSDWIDGHKTYIAILVFVAFHILKGKGLITLDAGSEETVNAVLLGATGLALRSAIKKAEVPS